MEKVEKANTEIPNTGRAPACPTCMEDDSAAFAKINPDELGTCMAAVSHETYVEQRVCNSSPANKGEFLQYTLTREFNSQPRQYRKIDFFSTESALNGTFLTIQDVDASQRAASQMGSDMFILPRKTPPKVEEVGNELKVTLPTGEAVYFNKATREITRGALKEGAPSFGSSTIPGNVQYSGTGISIRMNLRTYDDPRRKAVSAEISQGGVTCTVPRAKLFTSEGIPNTNSDATFLRAIKLACPGKNFSLN